MAVPSPKQLLKLLEKIDRPGAFCTHGSLPSILPGLAVEGLGQVALPLGKRDAAALKKLARQALVRRLLRQVQLGTAAWAQSDACRFII